LGIKEKILSSLIHQAVMTEKIMSSLIQGHHTAKGRAFCTESGQCLAWSIEASFAMSVKIDARKNLLTLNHQFECAYVSFCYEIKLEPSDMY
jgi:hypothetical protein